ncbi:MAG: squalene/phytoene synthase family protein [Rhodospirillales bacterium]
MASALSPLGQQVRQEDHDRYLTLLFAPAAKRERLFALLAFNQEIARTAERVSEPLLGEMRLAWWRDAIEASIAGGPVPVHPVMAALAECLADGTLPADALLQQIEARRRDLDSEGFASLAALRAYARETAGELNRLQADLLGLDSARQEIACDLGTAWGLVGQLRSYAAWLAGGRLWLPRDLLAEQGLTRQALTEGLGAVELAVVVEQVAAEAETLLAKAAASGRRLPAGAASPFLLGSLTRLYLGRLRAGHGDPRAPGFVAPPPQRIFHLTWAVLRRRW